MRRRVKLTGRDLFFYLAGLVFLLLAKAKHTILGYSTPKPFGMEEAERCVPMTSESWMTG